MPYKDPEERRRKAREHSQRPEAKARRKLYEARPEVRDRKNEYMRGHYQANKAHYRAAAQKSRKAGHRLESDRRYYLRTKYGLTLEEYDALLTAQDGSCGLCGLKPTKRHLSVDHCHETGRIRGLLCVKCNAALGTLGDNEEGIRRALDWVTR